MLSSPETQTQPLRIKGSLPAVKVGVRPIVVGICGYKGHGKDTAATILIEKYNFVRLSFADGVKNVCSEILHEPIWKFHDPEWKESLHKASNKTLRQWMQLIGTEVGRNIWGDVWINWWRDEVVAKDLKHVVVTDMRFWNEFGMITNGPWDSMTLRVFNPRLAAPEDTHESERYALTFPVNAEITNDSSKEQLWERIESKVLRRWPELW